MDVMRSPDLLFKMAGSSSESVMNAQRKHKHVDKIKVLPIEEYKN